MNPESNFGYLPEYSGIRVSQLGDVDAENPGEGDVIQWSEIKKQWISKNGSNSWKGTVNAASTGSLTLSGEQSVDGVSLVTGNRILVKDQGANTNGIYVVSTGTWERSSDLTVGSNAAGTAVFVNAGTTNGDTIWVCTNNSGSDIVGTDTLVFSSLTSISGAAGANTQVQFNNSGSLAGNAALTFNSGNGRLTSTGYTDGTVLITGGAISNATSVFSTNLTTTTGATNLANGGGATLGLYGVTPIVKPTTAVAAATFVANSSGISNDSATYGGYTMGQVVQALKNLGALT
ncbi:MAG: hypothetical protein GY932_10090 [Arcobacter sp.]|nr:hypothetical protein [Flavobacteriaceae bacterium]MCP4970930.1 hypothetical protein [Arcobacter sp.]